MERLVQIRFVTSSNVPGVEVLGSDHLATKFLWPLSLFLKCFGMLIIQKVRIMIYLIHDRIISEKVIATSDTHIKVNSTSFCLFSCLSFLPESVVFLLALIVSLPFFCKISSLKQSNLSLATNETVRKDRKGYRVGEVVIYIYTQEW